MTICCRKNSYILAMGQLLHRCHMSGGRGLVSDDVGALAEAEHASHVPLVQTSLDDALLDCEAEFAQAVTEAGHVDARHVVASEYKVVEQASGALVWSCCCEHSPRLKPRGFPPTVLIRDPVNTGSRLRIR